MREQCARVYLAEAALAFSPEMWLANRRSLRFLVLSAALSCLESAVMSTRHLSSPLDLRLIGDRVELLENKKEYSIRSV